MKLLRHNAAVANPTVVAIGNFDGLHKGHQVLIEHLIHEAKSNHLASVLMTFEPHPSEFFSPDHPIARLMRFNEKWTVLQQWSIDYVFCLSFNKQLAQLSAEDFVKNILVAQLHAKAIIVGNDFHFGAKRAGNIALLESLGKKYGFEVHALPPVKHHNERIGSTLIRNALKNGNLDRAVELLGRPFTLSGRVAYGNQLGRVLGYPTANIYLRRKHVPLQGIFIVRVLGLKNTPLYGVASVGYRPTFDGKKIILEVYILDFNEMIYGQRITVEFIKKIRDEERFDSVEKLVEKIKSDVEVAKDYWNR